MSEADVNVDENAEIVPAHARRVVHDVLDRWVVKKTGPRPGGQELYELASLGPDLSLALAEAIDDQNPFCGLLAAWMLLKLAEKEDSFALKRKSALKRASAALVAALKDEKPVLPLYACIQLSNGAVPREVVPLLTQFLSHTDTAFAVYAASALTWCGEFGAQAIPVLTKALHGDDELLATVAADALGRLGLRNDEAISVLVRRLNEASSSYQYSVILAVKALGKAASAALPKLTSIVRNRRVNNLIRAAAAEALPSVQPDSRETRGLLMALLDESDWLLIEAGLRGLERSGGMSEKLLPRLGELLRSTTDNHRRVAALGFRMLGPKAETVLPELIRATCHEYNREVLVELATACAFLGPASAKPLCEVVQRGNLIEIGGAFVALGLMGKVAAEEIARTLVRDADEMVRRTGVALLRTLGPDAEPALGVLSATLPTLDDERAIDALTVISNCQSGALAVVPEIISCVLEREGAASKAAAAVLTGLGTAVVPILEELVKNTPAKHRQKIDKLLQGFRPAEHRAFERLLALNADHDLLLFVFAGEVIERAGPIGLRKVASRLENIKAVDDMQLPTSEASVREMLSELNRKLPAAINRQTTKGTCLTAEGRALLREAREYLRWRGHEV
ncbi:MAG TPA: HEAT repeat domain-containing protein [Planctomycetaceae bacterium]|nr:HEAT repeat domain-containing protein [Planctomycetaceae bacterium]